MMAVFLCQLYAIRLKNLVVDGSGYFFRIAFSGLLRVVVSVRVVAQCVIGTVV
ncbi:hypothetical protein MGMO_50c00250 [Methyloglobulus morosus KoM1]|uniref:Uncharacterized protein n=1 Tax=Methyloglobulus morosus KoM1 TaxID=1116472 RepID=V5BXY8_9GAMM|nr:hypothetical protein MGMO_50c00250 [Methyloglobulus morosus KoM1]